MKVRHHTSALIFIQQIKNLIREYRIKRKILSEYSIDTFQYDSKLYRVTATVKYNSSSNPQTTGIKRDGHGFGVGENQEKAILKAITESLERYYAGEFFFDAETTFKSLKGSAIDPRSFLKLNHRKEKSKIVDMFDAERKYKWIYGTRLQSKKPFLVLCDQVFYPLRKEILGYEPVYRANSSGMAGHFSAEHAITSGLLELIERDAIALAWYTNKKISRIDPVLIPGPLSEKISYWEREGYEVHFYDFSVDSVPVVVCFFFHSKKYPYLSSGARASFSYTEAFEKSFEEAEDVIFSLRSEKEISLNANQVRSPADHARYYAHKKNAKRLLKTLNTSKLISALPLSKVTRRGLILKYDPLVVFLHSSKHLHIVRVLSERLLPLTFGYGMEAYGHQRVQMLNLKACPRRTPHFFP